MKNHVKDYKAKLEKGICEYMDSSVSERSATAVHHMLECLEDIDELIEKMEGSDFSYDDAIKWAEYMKNADGTTGAHWTIDQTSAVAAANGVQFGHIHAYDWWITMNMMYSDYGKTAEKFGVGTPEFFADLARDFLFDPDGPGPVEKLSAYYHHIACPGY